MKKTIIITNMTCGSCVARNTSTIESIKWVKSVQINLSNSQAIIDFQPEIISLDAIISEIKSNGFWVEFNSNNSKLQKNQANRFKIKFILSAIFSFPVFLMMFIDTNIGIWYLWVDLSLYIFSILTAIVVFVFGFNFHKNFLKSLQTLHFNMDSLVSLGTMSSFFYSIWVMFLGMHVYFEAAVAIITLINLWKYFEEKSKQKAGDAISKLLELWVKQAHIITQNWEVLKNIEDIKISEIMKIFPGEKIPLDGEIISWISSVDESMITGESIPVEKNIWDTVLWSTLNCDNYLEVKVTKTNKQWTLHQIIQMVNQAQSSRADVQKLVDKISQIFVPVIIIFAICTFIAWFILTWDYSKALISAVATLVIACPCALWLATPAAIMVASWVWAKNGILIKNAQSLEKTQNIDVIVFDKTWTLTEWKPQVLDVICYNKNENQVVNIAQNLANNSHHPLSRSIKKYKDLNILDGNNISEIKWKWICWEYSWKKYYLWNSKLFTNNQINNEISKQLIKIGNKWSTWVLFWDENNILCIFEILDIPKSNAGVVIKKLGNKNIETIMLTWDNQITANAIAKQIWIKNVISQVLPEDKLKEIKKLQDAWKKVAFVWDGINDAPALVQADLSIAMWTWSDVAIDSADIVLLWWDLNKILFTLKLCKATLLNIKQNLFWAFLYNSIGIPLAAFWLLNPVFAALAMSLSSVSVVLNALRLNKIKK